MKNAVAQSGVGRTIDGVVEWWRTPLDWNWPNKVGEWASDQAEPITRRVDWAKQSAGDQAVGALGKGYVTEKNLTSVISAARELVRTSYQALVQTAWSTQKANAELLKPGSQSTPNGNSTYLPHQPRLPWQDVHVRIEGPSVHDLAMNFIRRWNSIQTSYLSSSLTKQTMIGGSLLPTEPPAGKGNGGTGGVKIDVLRSAPMKLQQDETSAMPGLAKPVAAQREIHDAMVAAIRGAERFIYIENQFFQSGFGTPSIKPDDSGALSGPMRYLLSQPGSRISAAVTRTEAANANSFPKNHIARSIGERIEHAIRWDETFHVYIILPVYPEGSLADLAVVGQIHWTMQSLVFASDSLVRSVRLALYAKKHCKDARNDGEWEKAERTGRELTSDQKGKAVQRFQDEVDLEETRQYLTLMNLRSCQTVDGKVCTEQAYVHSKLLIVDDRLVIVGSANINDRSLNGGRDSELAVCMTDLATTTAPIDGKNQIPVRKLAHEMRKNLWKKHFALSGSTDIVKPASNLASLIDKPADPATWQAIQAVAKANATAYSQAFEWVPKNLPARSSIWPVWNRSDKFPDKADSFDVWKKVDPFTKRMPFSKAFWEKPPKLQAPAGIKGFICELPLEWTLDENNHPGMNMILLTELVPPPGSSVPGKSDNALAVAPSEVAGVKG